MAQREDTDNNLFTLACHPHNHAANLSFSETLNYLKIIQRQVLSSTIYKFNSNVTKIQVTFWSEILHKLVTNLELSNALAHDAKPVFSFIAWRKFRDLATYQDY